jgi:hypothetical protein
VRSWSSLVDWAKFSAQKRGKIDEKSAIRAVDFWPPKRIIVFGLSRVSTLWGRFSGGIFCSGLAYLVDTARIASFAL